MSVNSAQKILPLSYHLIDPALRPMAEMLPATDLNGDGLRVAREQSVAFLLDPLPPPAPEVIERRIPGPPDNPDLRVVIVDPRPGGRMRPALLHTHAGGFVMGTAMQYARTLQTYAMEAGCVVVSVDYRLAPETPFPGALEDNYAGLRWLFENAESLGVDTARIAVGGESGGGGHAAALVIAARDRGEVKVAFQYLICPMLDDRTGSSREVSPYLGEFGWTAGCNSFGWTSLLGVPAGSANVPENAVPARVKNLSGLPPTYICVSSLDIFVEENLEYASRLVAAGVLVDLDLLAGGYHGFNYMVPDAEISARYNLRNMEGLRRGLAATAPTLL